jgi:putative transcriptional regulator
MAKEKINNHIRKLRFEQGEMTHIALEQKRYVPSLILAIKIARVFGKTVDDVFQLPDDGHVE